MNGYICVPVKHNQVIIGLALIPDSGDGDIRISINNKELAGWARSHLLRGAEALNIEAEYPPDMVLQPLSEASHNMKESI